MYKYIGNEQKLPSLYGVECFFPTKIRVPNRIHLQQHEGLKVFLVVVVLDSPMFWGGNKGFAKKFDAKKNFGARNLGLNWAGTGKKVYQAVYFPKASEQVFLAPRTTSYRVV